MNINEEYARLMRDAGFTHLVQVSEQEEQKLQEQFDKDGTFPTDVYLKDDVHMRYEPIDISTEDLQKICALKTYLATNTIKKCVIFFTVLAVLSLVAALIISLT